MNNQKGWILLLIGLLVCSFLGGAINVFFAPDRVREFVNTVLKEKQPKFSIDFQESHLQLSAGGWPTVAIELVGIELKAKDPCVTSSYIQMDRIVIPLNVFQLISKKTVRFGDIQAGNVRLHYRPPACAVGQSDLNKTFDLNRIEKFFQKRWSQEVINTTRFLDTFSIARFELTRDDQALPPMHIENFVMTFDPVKKESRIEAFVHLAAPLVGPAEFGRTSVEAVIRSDETQVRYTGNLKEGQFSGELRWAVDRGEIEHKVQTKDWPLKSLFQLAQHHGYFLNLKADFKNEWVSCDLTLNGLISEAKNWKWQLHQCRLYGDLGEMRVVTQEISFEQKMSEMKIVMQDAPVKKWLQTFGWAQNWGRISEFGEFQGEIKILNHEQIEISGDISNADVYLASFEKRVRQRIEKLKLSLATIGDRFSGRAEEFRLQDGELEGFLTFNFSFSGTGLIQLAIPKIVLSSDVQKILWGGRVPMMGLFGQASLAQGNWQAFEGELALGEWQTLNWEILNLKSSLKMAAGNWNLKVKADQFSPRPESKWLSTLNSITNGLTSRPNEMIFSPLEVDVQLFENQTGEWINLKSSLKATPLKFESSGRWDIKDGLSGTVKTISKQKTFQNQISGFWSSPKAVSQF